MRCVKHVCNTRLGNKYQYDINKCTLDSYEIFKSRHTLKMLNILSQTIIGKLSVFWKIVLMKLKTHLNSSEPVNATHKIIHEDGPQK